jgi:23S rRNA U2552 (ribose-2'-O)-methylase RlmE/FtsJ
MESKLIEINDKFKFLKNGSLVLDLGSAPGGWSLNLKLDYHFSKI